MIQRNIKESIINSLHQAKLTSIFGAKRTGKTHLLNDILASLYTKKILLVDGGDLGVSEIFSTRSLPELQKFVHGYDCLFIDDAQKIPNIDSSLKIIFDNLTDISVLTFSSSPFGFNKDSGNPLSGRMKKFELFPLTQSELSGENIKHKITLEDKLIYGLYPGVINAGTLSEKTEILVNIKNTSLFNDIVPLDNQKDTLFLVKLLRLIAFRIGDDISYSGLASSLNVNKKTVIRYLNLLEKTYILFSLRGYKKNLRSEYAKTPRYYFWDNGIRNVIVSAFNRLNSRDDTGKLWENYCISERLKKIKYSGETKNFYFWRTYDRKEIDFIEEQDGNLHGYEIKWKSSRAKSSKLFLETYPDSSVEIINYDNYMNFIV